MKARIEVFTVSVAENGVLEKPLLFLDEATATRMYYRIVNEIIKRDPTKMSVARIEQELAKKKFDVAIFSEIVEPELMLVVGG